MERKLCDIVICNLLFEMQSSLLKLSQMSDLLMQSIEGSESFFTELKMNAMNNETEIVKLLEKYGYTEKNKSN